MDKSNKTGNYDRDKKENKMVTKFGGGGGGGIGAVILLGGVLATAALASAFAARRKGRSSGGKDRRSFHRNPPPENDKLSEQDEGDNDALSLDVKLSGVPDDGFVIVDEDFPDSDEKLPVESQNKIPEDEQTKEEENQERESGDEEREKVVMRDDMEVKLEREELEGFCSSEAELMSETKCLQSVINDNENEERESGLEMEIVDEDRENVLKEDTERKEVEGFCSVEAELMSEKKYLQSIVNDNENEERESGLEMEIVDEKRENELKEDMERKEVEGFCSVEVGLMSEKKCLQSVSDNGNEKRESGLQMEIVDEERENELKEDMEIKEVEVFCSDEAELMSEKKCLQSVNDNGNEEREGGLQMEIVDEERENESKEDMERKEVEGFCSVETELMSEKKCLQSVSDNGNEKRESGLQMKIVDEERENELKEDMEIEEVEVFCSDEAELMSEKKCLQSVNDNGNEEREGGLQMEIVDEERENESKEDMERKEVEGFCSVAAELMSEKNCLQSDVIEDEIEKESGLQTQIVELVQKDEETWNEEKLVEKQEKCEEKQRNENGYTLQPTPNEEGEFDAKKNVEKEVNIAPDNTNEGIDDAKSGTSLETSEGEEEEEEEKKEETVEESSEAVWPAESAKPKLIDYEVGERDDQMNTEEEIFIDKYYTGKMETKNDRRTNSGRRRVATATLLLLSSLSCSLFFGLSYLNLCLLVFLTMLLSEIRGY